MEFKEYKPLGRTSVIVPYNVLVFDPNDLYRSRPAAPVTIEEAMFRKHKQLEAGLFCGGAQSFTTATNQEWSQEPMPSLTELAELAEKFRRPRLYVRSLESKALEDLQFRIPLEMQGYLDVRVSDLLARPPVGPARCGHMDPGIYKCGKDFYLVE